MINPCFTPPRHVTFVELLQAQPPHLPEKKYRFPSVSGTCPHQHHLGNRISPVHELQNGVTVRKTNQGGLCMSDTYLLHLAPRPAVVVSISRNLALKPASDIGSHERGMRLMHKSLIFLTPMQPMLSEKLRRLCFQCSHSTNNDELEQVVILVLPQRIRGATQGEEAAQAFHKKLQIKKKTENADIFQRNWLGSMSVLGCSGEKL